MNRRRAAQRRKRFTRLIERLPEAKVVEHGTHLSLEVRGKRFGWYLEDHHGDGRLAVHCKAAPGNAGLLVSADASLFHVPKYTGQRGWIGIWLDLPQMNWSYVEAVVVEAFCLTAPKSLLASAGVES